MKKFIFFRSDRLGDFLTLTGILKSIKKKYKDSHITFVCSPLNYNLVKYYEEIDRIYIYNKKSSFLKKISLFRKIIKKSFYCSFAVDGKSFSNLCNFFISAKHKFGLVYRSKLYNFWVLKPNILYNFLIFDRFETFTSKKDLKKTEHLTTKFLKLANVLKLNLKFEDTYYFKPKVKENLNFKNFYERHIKKDFILIHLDEKWNDIKLVEKDLLFNLLNLQKQIKKKVVITSFNNKFGYYKNLKKENAKIKSSKRLVIIENSNLFYFERLIKYSLCTISCHSGFIVHVAGANSARLIDIINKIDLKWYSCWIPKNISHKFIIKENRTGKISVTNIFISLIKEINKFKSF